MGKFKDAINYAAKFIEKQKGNWDHIGWENFLKGVQKKGLKVTEETSSYLGDMLEAAKGIYHTVPSGEPEDEKTGKQKSNKSQVKKKRAYTRSSDKKTYGATSKPGKAAKTNESNIPIKSERARKTADESAINMKVVTPLISEKMSKSFFMGLEKGLFMAATSRGSNPSAFSEKVSPLSKREEQWKRVIDAKAQQKQFVVFNNKREYDKYILQKTGPVKSEKPAIEKRTKTTKSAKPAITRQKRVLNPKKDKTAGQVISTKKEKSSMTRYVGYGAYMGR